MVARRLHGDGFGAFVKVGLIEWGWGLCAF